MAVSSYFNTVQKLYIAFYQRPADSGGLLYWAQRLEAAGGSLEGIIDAFATSPEATALYGPINNDTIGAVIDAIYQALFNRTPDAAGKQFYVQGFQDGTFTPGKIAMDVLNGAQNDDLVAVNNKVLVANRFTESVDGRSMTDPNFGTGTSFNATYSGNTDAEAARTFLAGVTASPTTIKSTTEVATYVQTSIADANDPIKSVVTSGQTFTLTTGVDTADQNGSSKAGLDTSASFKFSSANEKVVAAVGTLGAGDILIDSSSTDNDVLEYNANAAVAPTLVGIETVKMNVAAANAGLTMTNVSGAKTIEVTGTQNGQVTDINGTSAPTITLKDYNKTFTAALNTAAGTTAGGNAESLKFILSGTGSKAKLTLDTAAAGALESLSIESAGTAKNTLELTLDATAPVITAINKTTLTGAADLDLKVAHAVINGQEMDASGMTGKFNLTVDRDGAGTATTNLTNVKGYQGLTIVDGTAGLDRLVLSGVATGTTVTLANAFGAGAGSIAVKGAASKTDDTLTLVLDHSTDATDIDLTGANDFTINDVETITIKSEGGTSTGNVIQQLVTSAGAKIKVDGSTKLDLGLKSAVSSIEIAGSGKHKVAFQAATAYGDGKNLTVDASAATGETTIDLTNFNGTGGGAVSKATITGSAQKDTITVNGSNTDVQFVIDAGAGNDIVKVYTANVTASTDVTLGAGSDELIIDDVVGTKHVIVQDFQLGSGGDKLSVNTAGAMTFGGVGAGATASQLKVLNAAQANDAAFTGAAGVFNGLANNSEAAVLAINNASGVAELWYFRDADNGGDVDAGEVVKLASFENITTVGVLTDATNGFIAANFGT